MSTSTYDPFGCFCPAVLTHNNSFSSTQSNEKQLSIQEVISYKKKLSQDSKNVDSIQNKISLASFKKPRLSLRGENSMTLCNH